MRFERRGLSVLAEYLYEYMLCLGMNLISGAVLKFTRELLLEIFRRFGFILWWPSDRWSLHGGAFIFCELDEIDW